MTMLVSLYASEGIVFAADSQVVRIDKGVASADPPQQKVLQVPGLGVAPVGGVVGFFGLAEVSGGRPMSDWLAEQARSRDRSRDPGEFAAALREALIRDIPESFRRKNVSGFHIGAFEERDGVRVPTFHFVRNHSRADAPPPAGAHLGDYYVEEQLLGRDLTCISASDVRATLRRHQRETALPVWYRNGDLEFFGTLMDHIQAAAATIVANQQTSYAAPSTLPEWARVARTLVTTTSNLYLALFVRGAPLIGKAPTTSSIPWPAP